MTTLNGHSFNGFQCVKMLKSDTAVRSQFAWILLSLSFQNFLSKCVIVKHIIVEDEDISSGFLGTTQHRNIRNINHTYENTIDSSMTDDNTMTGDSTMTEQSLTDETLSEASTLCGCRHSSNKTFKSSVRKPSIMKLQEVKYERYGQQYTSPHTTVH